jgi:CheY-like chemotaxis protein
LDRPDFVGAGTAMSDDLMSLRMLLVAAAPPDQDLWRRAVSSASVPVEFSSFDVATAAAELLRGTADICVLDHDLPEVSKTALIKAARAAPSAPVVFVAAADGGERPEGIDGMLRKPAGLDDARKLVEICVRAKIPTRVLVVDDSGTMRNIVRKILTASRFAFDIHDASEGNAALAQLRSGKFGMVFLDYNMPGLDGFETLSEIKREHPHVAVVIMTSTLDSAIADRARASGALAFLKKPFYPADIDAVLERYYGLHAARD